MRVVIDVSFARRGPSGTQVFVDALVRELPALGIDVVEAEGRRGAHLNLAAEAAWQARLARRARGADVLHHPLPATGPTRIPQVITVHDVAVERLPEGFNARFRFAATRLHRLAARRAARIVTPSAATAADVRALWGRDAIVVPHGPGQAPEPNRGEPRHFLYVGDLEPRKNLGRLLAAYGQYRETAAEPLELVLAGRANVVTSAPGIRLAPDPDLPELHRHAAALVLPSLHEGFGLPALEALHAGTPVLVSDIPALREVCDDAARYCDPRDVMSIADGLTELATVGPLREELRRRGLARAAQFSWRRCAEGYAAAYRLAAGL